MNKMATRGQGMPTPGPTSALCRLRWAENYTSLDYYYICTYFFQSRYFGWTSGFIRIIFTLMIYQWKSDNHLVSSDFQQTCACLLKIWWILDSSDFQQIWKNYFNGDPVITNHLVFRKYAKVMALFLKIPFKTKWESDNRLVSSDFQQTCACLLKIWWILDSSDFQQICKNYFNGDPVITWSSKNMQKLWHCFWKSHLRHYRWVPAGTDGYR